jgi:hypothetical protein
VQDVFTEAQTQTIIEGKIADTAASIETSSSPLATEPLDTDAPTKDKVVPVPLRQVHSTSFFIGLDVPKSLVLLY